MSYTVEYGGVVVRCDTVEEVRALLTVPALAAANDTAPAPPPTPEPATCAISQTDPSCLSGQNAPASPRDFTLEDVAKLSGRPADVVRLRLEGKRPQEIADALGTSRAAVDQAATAARRALGIARIGARRREVATSPAPATTEESADEEPPAAALEPELEPASVEPAPLEAVGLEVAVDADLDFAEFLPAEPSPPAPAPAARAVIAASPEPDEEQIPTLSIARARGSVSARGHRAVSLAAGFLRREEKRAAALAVYPDDVERPHTRGDCVNGERPCPWVSCAHHLYLDVSAASGSLKLNFPHLEVWEMKETCTLDVADRGGITLEEVGEILNLTRERIRQVEVRGLTRMRNEQAEDALGNLSATSNRGHE